MSARFTVFAQDKSQRWTLVPGVASTRQIELRNDSDSPVECHLRVERPASASASPAVLTVRPHHARTADIIFLANWSPDHDGTLVLSLRDPQGATLGTFTQELVAAEAADCSIGLDVKEPVLVDGSLAGFKLWFSIASRGATPRHFEVDFVPHPSLRFPERTTVTLGPGEATAFEVPVAWDRSVRDIHWWNHPMSIEVFVPLEQGRRTATLPWAVIERHLDPYLNPDDRIARVTPVDGDAGGARPPFARQTAGQLKYTELAELKKLEQAVVGVPHVRSPANRAGDADEEKRKLPIGPIASTVIGSVALVLTAFFFLRPPVTHPSSTAVRMPPHTLAMMTVVSRAVKRAHHTAPGPVATPVWTTVAEAGRSAVVAVDSSRESDATGAAAPKNVALAPRYASERARPIERSAVVSMNDLGASYVQGGHALNVAWNGSAQASATVQVLDFQGKVIATRTVTGDRSATTVRLPRGYHGAVSVQVIASGYHGERVVQSTSLERGG